MATTSDFVKKASAVFQLRLQNAESDFSVFDAKETKMKRINGTKHFFSHFANGCFIIEKDNYNQSLLTFLSSSLNKFSIVFVIKIDGLWRFRGGIIATEDIGVIGYPLHTTFEMAPNELSFPEKFHKNTVMIIGIDTMKNDFSMSLKVFAEMKPNGGPYFGEISWHRYQNDSNIVLSHLLKQANAVPREYIQSERAIAKQPNVHMESMENVPKPTLDRGSKMKFKNIEFDMNELLSLPDTTDDESSAEYIVESVIALEPSVS